jgi:predicted nucleic acid-binding protein
MKRVFADANYFVALLNPKDEYHDAALRAKEGLAAVQLVTTDEVLAEFLTFFCGLGPGARHAAVQVVEGLRRDSRVTVVEQSRASFDGGLGR